MASFFLGHSVDRDIILDFFLFSPFLVVSTNATDCMERLVTEMTCYHWCDPPMVQVSILLVLEQTEFCKGKGKGRALVIVDTATAEALRYMARTKQRRTYLP